MSRRKMTKNIINRNKRKQSLWSESKSIILIIFIALLLRSFVFEIFCIPTGSMKASILEYDYIFATKYNYGYSRYSFPFSPNLFEGRIWESQPERGDVIIMRPPHDMETRYIKRLIGLPGDKIEIIDDVIYINDRPIERQESGVYIDEKGNKFNRFKETLPNGTSYHAYKAYDPPLRMGLDIRNFGPYYVEQGKYFFLGDNRDFSGDSRYQLGTVSSQNFIAKGQFVIFSTEIHLWDLKFGFFEQISRFWDWFWSIRLKRIFTSLYEQ